MIFSSKATSPWRQAVAGLVCAASLAVLVSCGGSTTQYETFKPGRVLAFGDDASVLTPAGRAMASTA
jgi:outer membrane lipase/esterase